jgi:hypothetical protein
MIPMFIVSKNRPLFLASYLDSLQGECFKPTVCYWADKPYRPAYQQIELAYPDFSFIREWDGYGILPSIRSWAKAQGPEALGVLSVDDNLVVIPSIDEFKIRGAMENPDCFGFSMRLQNGIRGKLLPSQDGVIFWDPRKYTQKHSWGYCWEFSSTVYRMEKILQVLDQCPPGSNANRIEIQGMRLFGGEVGLMACFERGPMVNVFVDSHRKVEFRERLTCREALRMHEEGLRLDCGKYRDERDACARLHVSKVFVK